MLIPTVIPKSATATAPVRYLDQVFSEWTIETGEYQKDYAFNIFQPAGDTEDKRPVIIVFHAGGSDIASVTSWCTDFVKLGYVTVAAEYKLTTGDFDPEKQMEAVINSWILIDYLRKNGDRYRIKKSKIFEMGISAGALVALQSAIGLNDKEDPYFQGAATHLKKITIKGSATLSGAANPDFMQFINAGDPPNHFYHGTEDHTIPYEVAVETCNTMIAAGIPSTLMAFEGKGHKLKSHNIIFNDLKLKIYALMFPN